MPSASRPQLFKHVTASTNVTLSLNSLRAPFKIEICDFSKSNDSSQQNERQSDILSCETKKLGIKLKRDFKIFTKELERTAHTTPATGLEELESKSDAPTFKFAEYLPDNLSRLASHNDSNSGSARILDSADLKIQDLAPKERTLTEFSQQHSILDNAVQLALP